MQVYDPSKSPKVLKVKVFDTETQKANDPVGEASINLEMLCIREPMDTWFNLQSKGKIVGKILLKTKFVAQTDNWHLRLSVNLN